MAESIETVPALSHPARPYLAAALVGIAAAFLLGGYEFVRSPANTLFTQTYGKERLPYVMAATPVAMLAMLYAYGRLLTWLGPRRTLLASTTACAGLIAGAYLLVRGGYKPAAAALYILREAYVVLLVEQYWSFLNSTLGMEHARKLNGPICGLGSLGAIAADLYLAKLSVKLGTPAMLLRAAAATVAAGVLMDLAHRLCGEPKAHARKGPSDAMGLRLFRDDRMLAALLAVIVLTQAVCAFFELEFQRQLVTRIPAADARTAWQGSFYAAVNMAAFAMQFAVTPLLLRWAPMGAIHLAIPLVHVGMCAWLLGAGGLPAAAAALLVFKVIDYSTFRAAKETLYIPRSFDARYRAKEVIDVFGYRFGKGGMSAVIAALTGIGVAFTGTVLAACAMGAAALWAGLAVLLQERGGQEPSSSPPAFRDNGLRLRQAARNNQVGS